MASKRDAAAILTNARFGRSHPCVPVRNAHYAERAMRRFRVLKIAALIGALVSGLFGAWQLLGGIGVWWIGIINLVTAVVLLAVPLLNRFGELFASLTFVFVAYSSVFFITWTVGTGSGLQLYFVVAASIVVLVLGTERIVLAGTLAALGAALAVILEVAVPDDTRVQTHTALIAGYTSSAFAAALMAFATAWYALRETARAEAAMEIEYQRSEQLLANMLPASIADRLKDPTRDQMIADRYDDASILLADIAGYTQRASETAPCDLVAFLDRLYTEFDMLVERHGLEKIKTTGDSYMVVSGVPRPRPDHLEALASLALDMAGAVAKLRDPEGRPVPIRIGMASGPVVAGVVGSRRFFYDVWGDAVNVASRMETTDQEGRIQVPGTVYERLKENFVFEERGDVAIKGKGLMHTWYLVGHRTGAASVEVDAPVREQVDVLGQ